MGEAGTTASDKLRDEDFDWILDTADLALVTNRFDKAVELSTQALEHAPDDLDALWILGASLIETGRNDECVGRIEPAVRESAPGAEDLALLLVVAHARSGRNREALEWLEVAMKDPGLREALMDAGDLGSLPTDPEFRMIVYGTGPVGSRRRARRRSGQSSASRLGPGQGDSLQ